MLLRRHQTSHKARRFDDEMLSLNVIISPIGAVNIHEHICVVHNSHIHSQKTTTEQTLHTHTHTRRSFRRLCACQNCDALDSTAQSSLFAFREHADAT